MGFLKQLLGAFGPTRRAAAPYQVTSNISPQENYAGYTTVPHVPWSQGDYVPDPYRLHAPFQTEREQIQIVTQDGRHFFDEGDPNLLRVPDQPLQQYWNEKKELPPLQIFAPAHGVIVPKHPSQRGWSQQFVQLAGRRPAVSGAAPPWLLSTPIMNVESVSSFDAKRAPISGAKAPKPKKSGVTK